MSDENQYYQLPESTDSNIRRMSIFLWVIGIFLIATVVLVFFNAQRIAQHIPFAAEEKFIKPYEKLIQKYYKGESKPEINAYLQNLADNLAKSMELPSEYNIKVHYVDNDMINAFATLGGHIFIFKGLIENLDDENSLAMVIAHEIAHIKHRDPVSAMGRGVALQLLYGFTTNDFSSSDIGNLSNQFGTTFFSRKQELKADQEAVHTLNKHYGHISGYDSFFLKVSEQYDDQETEALKWFSTHPLHNDRIQQLKKIALEKKFSAEKPINIPSQILDKVYEN